MWCSGSTAWISPLQTSYLSTPLLPLRPASFPSAIHFFCRMLWLPPCYVWYLAQAIWFPRLPRLLGRMLLLCLRKAWVWLPLPLPYPRQSVRAGVGVEGGGMVYFSAFQFKKRKKPALFSEKADSQAQEHSLKALCTPAVLVLVHSLIAQRCKRFQIS